MLLAGKVAVISGAASPRGIGFATARLFAAHGAKVAILDLDETASQNAAAELGGSEHRGFACDVVEPEACKEAARRVLEAFGQVDILINNAGISQPVKTMDITPEDLHRIMDVNLDGVLYLSQAFIPHMRERKQGSIACMSSVSAQRGGGIFGGPHYSAAKAAVLGLAKAMAREFGPDGIRVNCVTPGLIQTDITGGKLTDEMRRDILKGIPLDRLGDADDVADVYLFLASDLSSYVTGAVIDVNGGMLIHGERAVRPNPTWCRQLGRMAWRRAAAGLQRPCPTCRWPNVPTGFGAMRLRMGEVQGQGYIAQALDVADVLAVSYFHALRYRPEDPEWEGRDRFLLSIGHYAIALYAVLIEAGILPEDGWRPTAATTATCRCRAWPPTRRAWRSAAARSASASASPSACASA